MDGQQRDLIRTKKRGRATVRPITVGLFMLRAKQIGLSLMEMEYLTIGEVYDMVIEQGNDYEEWDAKATQDDIDKFVK